MPLIFCVFVHVGKASGGFRLVVAKHSLTSEFVGPQDCSLGCDCHWWTTGLGNTEKGGLTLALSVEASVDVCFLPTTKLNFKPPATQLME